MGLPIRYRCAIVARCGSIPKLGGNAMLELNSGFIFTIINLIVLVLLLKKFLFTPVTKIMEEREALIQNSVSDAARQKQEAGQLLEDAHRQVSGAAQEAERVSQVRLQQAKLQEEALLEEAKAESQRILEAGRKKAELERQRTLSSARAQVVGLAMETARKISGSQANPEHAESLFQSLLEEVGDTDE